MRFCRIILLKSHYMVTGMAWGLQIVQVSIGFYIFSANILLCWFWMKEVFIISFRSLKCFSNSMISIPLTIELVLAMACTIFPAIFLIWSKDWRSIEKQCILRLAAELIKWITSSSSFSNTTEPSLYFYFFSLRQLSTKMMIFLSTGWAWWN